MIINSNNNYDYVIYLRHDCWYINVFDISFFSYVNDRYICTPDFDLFGKYNFNDRFCISIMNTYKIYGNVFYKLLTSVQKKKPLHSETIIAEIIIKNNIYIHEIDFKFSKVRIDGTHLDEKDTKKVVKTVRKPRDGVS